MASTKGVRATQLHNFKGDPYLTKPDLEEIIGGTVENLIDENTNNLNHTLNPIHITSMERPNISTKTTNFAEYNDKRDQDFNNIKFIGNCEVKYGDDGKITIRIGDNVNSSLYNGTDGISNATVTGTRTGDTAGVPSAGYSNVSGANGSTSFQIFQAGDTITATTGTTAAQAGGLTDGTNGTTTHFDDNQNGTFKVYIKKNGNEEVYIVGPINESKTYYGKLNGEGNDVTGIACTVTNWGEEAMSAKGATGYMGNVNFTLTPADIYGDSTAFQVVKIEMCEGDSAVATWNADASVNGTYIYIKDTDLPGTPTGADYTLNATTKSESGVTFLTPASTITATATGMKNIGYPAATTNKANVSPNSGNAWFTALNDTATADFTTWTTVKDTTMSFSKSGIALLAGKFENPQVVIYGINYEGNGAPATSAKTNNKMWVYGTVPTDSNITDNRWLEDFSAKSDYANVDLTSDTTALQVYQGYLKYPNVNYSAYNVIAGATNPNYSACTGDRYYYMKFSKPGSMPKGSIDILSKASIASDISSGNLVVEVAKTVGGTWYNVCFGQTPTIGTADSTFGNPTSGTATSKLNFVFTDGDAVNELYVRITMKAGCTSEIRKVLLTGSTKA